MRGKEASRVFIILAPINVLRLKKYKKLVLFNIIVLLSLFF